MAKEQALSILTNAVAQILSKVRQSKVFVVGGSDEMTLSLIQAMEQVESLKNKEHGIRALHFDSSIDVKPKHQRQIDEEDPTYHETNHSYFRQLFAEEVQVRNLSEMTFVGVQGHRVTKHEVEVV